MACDRCLMGSLQTRTKGLVVQRVPCVVASGYYSLIIMLYNCWCYCAFRLGVETVSIKDFSCDLLELEFEFSQENFNKEAFLADVKAEAKSAYAWSYGSIKNPNKVHAHLAIRFLDEAKGSLRIAFHASDVEVKDIRPPYMEDCTQWIGSFFRSDEMFAEIRAVFLFDRSYSPLLALPFPLVTESKELSGSMVSGVMIELPKQTHIRRAIIQKGEEETVIAVTTRRKVKLTSFDLDKELSKVAEPILKLVKKEEIKNDPTRD